MTSRCWRPGCARDVIPTPLAGDGWLLYTCARDEEVARAVTGIRQPRAGRQRDGQQGALFEVAT